MLLGEPYVPDYLESVEGEMCDWDHEVVSGTVGVWWWSK